MGLVQNFCKASLVIQIVLGLLTLAVALAWTSFVTASWGDGYENVNEVSGYGLWRKCGNNEITSDCVNLMGWNLEWYRAVQAFAILGFICCNVSFLLVLLLIFNPECQRSRSLNLWLCVLGFCSCIFYLLAIIIFGASFDDAFEVASSPDHHLQYGWGLAICVLFLELVVAILMIFESINVGSKLMDL